MAEEFVLKDKYNMDDLVAIIKVLRAPGGCPWDREQTHESIKKNFIEETYEVVEAINKQSADMLREELGDVLLQIVLHSEMESARCSTICSRSLVVRYAPYRLTFVFTVVQLAQTVSPSAVIRNSQPFAVV